METTINAIHFVITDRLTAFINKKADRLGRHYPDVRAIEFNLKVIKPETAMNKHVVAKMTMPGAPEMIADKTANSFEEAVDLALEALDRQLEKSKGKK